MLAHWITLPFFSVVSAILAGRVDVVYPSIETFRSGVKRVTFRAFDQDFDLRLEPAGELISDYFNAVGRKGSNLDYQVDVDSLKQKLFRDKERDAALYIDDDGPITINGIIRSALKIEPLESNKRTRDGRLAHRVIEVTRSHSLFIDKEIIPPGVKGGLNETKPQDRQEINGEWMQLVIILEPYIIRRIAESGTDTIQFIFLLLAAVQNRMDTLRLGIRICLLQILDYKMLPQAYFIENSYLRGYWYYVHATSLLGNMAKYFNSSRNYDYVRCADAIVLLSGLTLVDEINGVLETQVKGIAYVGGVCDGPYKCAVVEHSSNFFDFVDNVAHELAHLLGSPHDQEGSVLYIPGSPGSSNCLWRYGYIMSYMWSSENGTKFSKCTKANIQNLFTLESAECLKKTCHLPFYYFNPNYYYYYPNYRYPNYGKK